MNSPFPAPVIDSHIHLWDFSLYQRRDWLLDKPALMRDFLPADVKPGFDACGVQYGIVLEAAKYSHRYNLWWLETARQCPWLCGALPGCILEDEDTARRFADYARFKEFLGVRAAPAGRPMAWLESGDTRRGLALLAERGLCLELLAGCEALDAVGAIAREYSGLTIVIDHCGLPPRDPAGFAAWERAIGSLARHERVFVKYSGFFFNSGGARDPAWFKALSTVLFERLGVDKLIWGSNWPVDALWASYEDSFAVAQDGEPKLRPDERNKLYGGNAVKAFRIELEETRA